MLIQEALERIETYKPTSEAEFLATELVQDAVVMRLQEIGENLARIRDNDAVYFEANADDEWHKIIGLRNLISHGYDRIEMERIWDIVINHLPPLSKKVDQLLQNWA